MKQTPFNSQLEKFVTIYKYGFENIYNLSNSFKKYIHWLVYSETKAKEENES